MRDIKLALGIPSARGWSAWFGLSAMCLLHYIYNNRDVTGGKIKAVDLACRLNNSILPKGRHQILEDSIKRGMTHLLFLDDDMKFPGDAANRLISRGLPVVGANYAKKDLKKLQFTAVDKDGKEVDSRGKTGVEEVSRLATGMMMIDLGAIKHLEAPWFAMPWVEEWGKCMGEDTYFCRKLRENNISIYVDHDLSAHIGHCADVPIYQGMFNE